MGRRECTILLLQLLEQPHVLNSNNSLVGEGLEKRDLSVGKRPGLRTSYGDHTKRRTVAQHRDGESTSQANRSYEPLSLSLVLAIDLLGIRHVDHGALDDRPARHGCLAGAGGPDATRSLKGGGRPVVCRHEVHQFTVERMERAEDSIAQPR